jgi:hypothetical protein
VGARVQYESALETLLLIADATPGGSSGVRQLSEALVRLADDDNEVGVNPCRSLAGY